MQKMLPWAAAAPAAWRLPPLLRMAKVKGPVGLRFRVLIADIH